ncbi:uncharacterized protein LOC6036581 isoform X2 [Culex quinquefasciatus]|uniref:uncharacterized protein LOC6036581 isoform X2 n=1 Tax=Culex quinquefasciatus TaxID=7176 RepID=UPI0018E3B651|nr:uncharacterized protein LOC6036581 isoform X2 [Culex quinquefasciatus]
MNLHKLSKRHSIHSMQQQQPPASSTGTATGRQADEFSGADATTSGGKQQQQQQQRKKGKFRLKERSCSSVRERFVNDPAYTEDVRHLALPMRRNSGPEHHGAAGASSRRFYTMPKKKSNSVGKDYLRSSSGSRGSREFYTVDVTAELARVTNTPEPVDQSNVQVKVRRKKYNNHNSSAEMLRFNDESSSSDNLRHSKSSTLERRGRSLDRRGLGDREPTGWFQREGSRKEVEEEERTRGRNRNVMRRQNAAGSTTPDSAMQQEDEDAMYRAAKVAAQAAVAAGEDVKESKSKFQIGKRFLKGEIGIKSFNYYLLKEGLKSSKKNLLKQKSAPVEVVEVVQPVVVAVPQERRPSGLSKSEENIYEEIYFEEKPGDSNDEKIQFIDCELCVQECNNSNCEVCHSRVPKHKLQQHHHHQQHQQLPLPPPPQVPKPSVDKQNIYEQLKQIPLPGTPGPPPPYQAVEGGDLSSVYQSSSSMTYGSSPGNVLQYQSYNPKNPNVFKIETTPVAFSCDYNPIQQIYYKPGYGSVQQQQRPQHIYQRPHNLTSSSQSDFYQEVNRKKSSSSSDSLQARMQRELYQQASLYYYQQAQKQTGAGSGANPSDPSKIYKTNSNASILSEASAKSENSLKHPQRTGNMSDSSLGDSLFSYPANRRYFGSSESCRFASECRRCSLDVDKCSYSDTCRYDCRNCDCSSSYFSSDFDDPAAGGRKSGSRQDNYGVPAYAEDFMKHVNNVKRNQLGQQKQTASGKIYETPTTYAGVSKKTHHEHTYETLKNNVILYQQPYKSTPKYEESSRLSISQSHELLLSPSRSKIPLESRYSLGGGPPSTAISRYGYAKSSSTLPAASSFAAKTRSTEFFPQAGSLPKATLSKLNHDYAEIVQLPTPAAPPKDPKRSSNVKYTAPQPPKPATTPTTRRQAPPIPANPPLASDPLETRSIGGGSDRDKSLPRKDRADFEKSKRGAAAAVAASLQDQPQEKKEPKEQPVQQLTVATAKKEKKERRHPARKKVEDDGNFTDDEDDEVFLSERSNEKLRSARKENPPKEQTTTNAAAVAGSAEPSSQPPPRQQPKQTVSSTTPQRNSPNESESLRTLAAAPSERASDRRVSDGGGPSKIAKTADALLSSDLAVPGETSARLTVPASDQAVPSNRFDEKSSPAASASPSRSPSATSVASGKDNPPPVEQDNNAGEPEAKVVDGEAEADKLVTNDESGELELDFPLPEIPVKHDLGTSSDASFRTATDNDTATTTTTTTGDDVRRSPKVSSRNKDKSGAEEMHYRNPNDPKPTYLFGENLKKNEIFLNKSGWVQVSQPSQHPGGPGPQRGSAVRAKSLQSELMSGGPKVSRRYIEYDENRYGRGTKIEDLINRNEARRSQLQKIQRQDNVTILKIDPQHPGGRPECLPIKRNLADNSPPPVTPILSPPPAFQDSKYKTRLSDIKPGTRIFLSVVDNENRNPKGMVFSRSFEYDLRQRYAAGSSSQHQNPPQQQQQTQKQSYSDFSKSFDFESSRSAAMPKTTDQPFIRRNRSPTFATLTGNSPNYLTKKEKPKDPSPVFPKSIPGTGLPNSGGYEPLKRFGDKNKSLDSMMSSSGMAGGGGGRSRRSQFSTKANSTPGLPTYGSSFRSDSVGNTRLNSCDSGARSDYSNDGVEDDDDDEEDVSEDQSSSLALSYKSTTSYMNQMKGRAAAAAMYSSSQQQQQQLQQQLSGSGNTLTAHAALKPQRSLTPERLYDNDDYESMRNLKKQRSLTPEKRSRTPDDRPSKAATARGKGEINSSQSSLVSRQSSGSRSSTLERRYDEACMSRSTSSSSYSGDEAHTSSYRRSQLRGGSGANLRPGNVGGDYKIRRSSCTASSCDFWPHCGAATTPQTLTVVGHGQLTKSGSENCLNRRSLVVGDIVPTGVSSAGGAGSGEVIVISGGSRGATMVPVKANSYGGTSGHAPLRKQQNVEIHDRDLPAVLGTPRYLYGMTSAKANSITFLGEHEMPITRDPTQQLTGGSNNRQDSTTSSRRSRDGNGGSSNSSVKSNSSNNYKVSRSPNNRRHGSNGSGGSGSAVASSGKGEVVAVAAASTASVEKTGSGSDGRDRKASKPYSMRPRSASIKRKFEMKLKSRSLPKSFMRHR